jgi:hypothetical protein
MRQDEGPDVADGVEDNQATVGVLDNLTSNQRTGANGEDALLPAETVVFDANATLHHCVVHLYTGGRAGIILAGESARAFP